MITCREKETDAKTSKEDRKKLREERRKARLLDKLKEKSSDAMDEKIAKEERKILKAKRRLEAIRLIEALFRRISKVRQVVLLYLQCTVCFAQFYFRK